SLAGQVVFSPAPIQERARRVLSKLRQTPRLVQAARDNIKDPPGIFVKVGLETLRGAMKFIHEDLPKAFSPLDDMHLLGDLADAGFLSLGVCQHVGARPVRAEADRRLLLPDRCGSLVDGRAEGRASARFQLPHALVDLDPRGVSRALPAFPAPAPRGIEGAQV